MRFSTNFAGFFLVAMRSTFTFFTFQKRKKERLPSWYILSFKVK